MTDNALWSPSDPDSTNIAQFARSVGVDLDELHSWSVSHSGEFWAALWDQFVIGDRGDRLVEAGESAKGRGATGSLRPEWTGPTYGERVTSPENFV